MKRIIMIIIVLVIALTGLSLLLYPTVSDYVNSLSHRRAIVEYERQVAQVDEEEYVNILEDALAYNAMLADNPLMFMIESEQRHDLYMSLLNVSGNGIIGYITIPKADVRLPIYHGATETVLQSGVGHVEGTSFPVGGEDAHTLLSGHRGLPSSKLFTNLDRMEIGDTFTIRVLNEVFTYEVDQITVVRPYEVNQLTIEKGRTLCTLVTCTPYGINTHRLLVRGTLIETPAGAVEEVPVIQDNIVAEAVSLAMEKNLLIPAVIFVLAIVVGIVVAIVITKRRKKEEKQRNRFTNNPGDNAENALGSGLASDAAGDSGNASDDSSGSAETDRETTSRNDSEDHFE